MVRQISRRTLRNKEEERQALDKAISRIISLKQSYEKQPSRDTIAGESVDVKRLWSLS